MRRTLVLHLLFIVWPSLSSSLQLDHRQKRQLNWNDATDYHYDHLAISSDHEETHDNGPSAVPGEPGVDYPILPLIPLTDFHCRGRVPGFYGDTQTACQVFHVCDMSGRQDSFLCPNGTIFSQKLFACDWWYNVQCAVTRHHYQLNRNLYKGSSLNLYGTPSFWNWLSDTEETFPQPGSTRPATKSTTVRNEKARAKSIVTSAVPASSSNQLEQVAPTTFAPIQVDPLPSSPRPQRPVVVEATTPVPRRFQQHSEEAGLPDGFTKDYAQHYNWMHSPANQPHDDMAPELSWADLSPNGPLMTPFETEYVTTLPPLVDRRRNARPAERQIPIEKKSKAMTMSVTTKPTTIAPKVTQKLVESPSKRVTVPIASASKLMAPPKPLVVDGVVPVPVANVSPSSSPSKTKSKQKPTKPTIKPLTQTTTTTYRPDYVYEDDDVYYDDTPVRLAVEPNLPRAVTVNSRTSHRRKQQATQFVPSRLITSKRSDDLVAKPYTPSRTPKSIGLASTSAEPQWASSNQVARSPSYQSTPVWLATSTARPYVKPIQDLLERYSKTTTATGLVMERLSPTFRPSQPIPVPSSSKQPKVRTSRAHPPTPTRGKRKRKTSHDVTYDPRLDRPYDVHHPIWQLQNWESTKV